MLFQTMMNLHNHHRISAEVEEVVARAHAIQA
jgi:hypothetical protein